MRVSRGSSRRCPHGRRLSVPGERRQARNEPRTPLFGGVLLFFCLLFGVAGEHFLGLVHGMGGDACGVLDDGADTAGDITLEDVALRSSTMSAAFSTACVAMSLAASTAFFGSNAMGFSSCLTGLSGCITGLPTTLVRIHGQRPRLCGDSRAGTPRRARHVAPRCAIRSSCNTRRSRYSPCTSAQARQPTQRRHAKQARGAGDACAQEKRESSSRAGRDAGCRRM